MAVAARDLCVQAEDYGSARPPTDGPPETKVAEGVRPTHRDRLCCGNRRPFGKRLPADVEQCLPSIWRQDDPASAEPSAHARSHLGV